MATLTTSNGVCAAQRMELYCITRLADFLTVHTFRSKKELAEQTGIPYRTLLRVCTGQASKRNELQVMERIIRYCVQHQIPIDRSLELKL